MAEPEGAALRTRGPMVAGLRRHAVALAATAVALVLSLLVDSEMRPFVFPEFFLGAVAFSAWYGGLGAGLLATTASVAATFYFLLPSLQSLRVAGLGTAAEVGIFLLTAILISMMRGTVRAAGAEVRDQQRRLTFLAEASGVLGESLDYETTLQAVARLAVPFLADYCGVDILDGEGRIQRLALEHVDPVKADLACRMSDRYPAGADGPHPLGQALRTGRAQIVPEVPESLLVAVARDEGHLAMMRELGVRSVMSAPLRVGGQVLGAISFMTSVSGRRYGQKDLALAEDLAARCAAAIDHARLYRAAQQEIGERTRAEQRLAVQYATTRTLAHYPTLEEAAPHILRGICECLGWVHGAIWCVDGARGVIRCLDTWHVADAGLVEFEAVSRRAAFPRGTGLPGRVWASGEPLWIPDVVKDPNFPRAAVAARESLHAALGFPIRSGSEVIGVLEFFSPRILPPDDALLAMIGTVGTQIGQFMQRVRAEDERARLLEHLRLAHGEAKAAERRAAFLGNATTVLSASLDYRATLDILAGLTVPDLADWCTVDILAEDGSLERMGVAHTDPERAGLLRGLLERYPPSPDHPFRRLISGGDSALLPVVQEETVLAASQDQLEIVRRLDIRSFMLVPLVARGRTLGAMALASSTPGRYGPAELRLAEDLGQRAALVVDNARLYHEAREVARRKDEFLAMLGHELRNPLGAICAAAGVLEQVGGQGDVVGRQRAIIDRQTRHLARLVDDLLDVSRVVSGKIGFQPGPVDVNEVGGRCVDALRARVAERRHALVFEPASEPVVVRGDAVRLEQVVFNLLDNAVKYTPDGGSITIAIERLEQEAVIRVRDTGMGITPELLPRVFDLFAQADRSLDRAEGGLGLGLTLVRRLVEQHGGSVAASSAGPERGSEFVVSLPLATDVAAPAAAPAEGLEALTPGRSAHILVIEDNIDGRDALCTLLELWGHRVDIAGDGPSGVEVARRVSPDVALIDIGLPGLDGYQVAQALRAAPGRKIRMVALTGYGQPSDRRRALDAGFDAHLVKPVEPEELARLLARLSPADAA